MAINRFDSYFNKIKTEIDSVKEQEGYSTESYAFAHWFFKNEYGFDDETISEIMVDGPGDNGIDAIVYDKKSKHLDIFQFKFPGTVKNVGSDIPVDDIQKTLLGLDLLMRNDGYTTYKSANDSFIKFKDMLREAEVYSCKITFVSFNKGVTSNLEILDNYINRYKNEFGTEVNYETYDRSRVCDLFDRIQRRNNIEINLSYKSLANMYSSDVFIGVVNAKLLLEGIKSDIKNIFDENIRLVEEKSNVNANIKKTAVSDESINFFCYNNGITLICEDAHNSLPSNTIKLEGVSIINGCQTVNSLYEVYQEGSLKDNVDLLVRIIKTSDYEQRAKITEYLNTQTPVKESYFISNHTVVRDLQTKLLDHGYFLERQIGEVSYKRRFGDSNLAKDKVILKLEDAIQAYAGYYEDKFAAIAKRNKGDLFSGDVIEEILGSISVEKVIFSYNLYKAVQDVVSRYRRFRRNSNNTEFSDFLGISQDSLKDDINKYLFVNTADILILNSSKHIKNRLELDENELIRVAIELIRDYIEANDLLNTNQASTITKTQTVFKGIQNYIDNEWNADGQ